jgi:hypothetical protein
MLRRSNKKETQNNKHAAQPRQLTCLLSLVSFYLPGVITNVFTPADTRGYTIVLTNVFMMVYSIAWKADE